MSIGTVGVVGCGTMGSGICEVVGQGRVPGALRRGLGRPRRGGLERIRGSLQRAGRPRQARPGRARRGPRAHLGRHRLRSRWPTPTWSSRPCRSVSRGSRRPSASSTPSSSPTRSSPRTRRRCRCPDIAVTTHRASRILGFHFFNPAPVMKLIELVTTVVTDPQVIADANEFAERIGKTPVVAKDRAGFVANLLLFPYLNQAVGMLEAGYATREDIDAAMQLGTGHPMGPLALMDLIGLDSAYAIMMRMYEQFGDTRHAPRPMIRQLLAAEFRGRKSGRGFYATSSPTRAHPRPTRASGAPADAESIAAWTKVGVLGTGTMATGIAEVSAKAGYEVVRARPHGREGRGGQRRSRRAWARRWTAASSMPAARDEALERITATDDVACLRRLRPRHRGRGRGPGAQARVLRRSSTRRRSPSAVLATTTSSMPVDRLRDGDRRAGAGRRRPLLQPGRDHAPGRGRADRAHRPQGRRAGAGAAPKARQAPGAVRRPRRLHRQRAALPVPQRRRQDARWRATPPSRTSTPR